MVGAIERAYRATDRAKQRPIWHALEHAPVAAQEGQGFTEVLVLALVASDQAKGKDEALKLIHTTWRTVS